MLLNRGVRCQEFGQSSAEAFGPGSDPVNNGSTTRSVIDSMKAATHATFFLLRTCRVGDVGFSQERKFITPYHFGEMGMESKSVDVMLADWHDKLRGRDV